MVALRIDVDTRRGLREGVPRLLDLLRSLEARASFFVTMGPDRSGFALRRAWRPSFLAKMWRTRGWRLYGFRTLVSGTLIAAAPVGAGAPDLLRQIAVAGHEVAPHGFDHVGWQDRVARLRPAAVRADLTAATRAFQAAVGSTARASAAPGWRTTELALAIQEEFEFGYASDVRGEVPFRPRVDGTVLTTVQIPTTMPTMDELLGRVPDVAAALEASVRPGVNVLTAHAEVEGGELLGVFQTFLAQMRARGIAVIPLGDVAEAARGQLDALPVLPIGRGAVPGRSGWVAVAVRHD